MIENLKKSQTKKLIDLSGEVKEVTIDYNKLILSWLFWVNPNNPAELIDTLDAYRKVH